MAPAGAAVPKALRWSLRHVRGFSPDPLGHLRLQAPEIAVADAMLVQARDSVVEILGAGAPRPASRGRQPARGPVHHEGDGA